MIRTQIQLPDDVYHRARKLCDKREVSMAELARRGIEYMLSVYSDANGTEEWHPPQPRRLGWKGLSDARLKAEAQLANTEVQLTRKQKH